MAVPSFKLKAAAVHAAPVFMDKEATTAKTVRIIKDAGEQGIKLLVFPETFIPGYPVCKNGFHFVLTTPTPLFSFPPVVYPSK